MKSVLAALVLGFGAAGAAAGQDVPPDVMQAYRAHQAALEAGDLATALREAENALAAAEAAGVDPGTRAVLAHNAANMRSQQGDHDRAAAHFQRAAALTTEAGGDAVAIDRYNRIAAESLLFAGEADRAEALADEVADRLEALPESPERNNELGRARGLQAHAMWRDGRSLVAGVRGREAMRALQRNGVPDGLDPAFYAFYSGVERAFRGDYRGAAEWFGVSEALFRRENAEVDLYGVARAWGRYARGRLDDADRRILLQTLSEGGWLDLGCEAECPADDEPGFMDGPGERVDAAPVRRASPRYPGRLEAAAIDGVVLVRFAIGQDGRVQDPEIVFSAPHPDFGDASLRAMRDWRYTPATIDGEPVVREAVYTQFEFMMSD
ncbi:MAG: energy transducer TonB [Oceanicaulis sp.]